MPTMSTTSQSPVLPREQAVPGVYVRTSGQPADIDMLWNGSRTYFKDDRSGIFNLAMGFIAGCVVTTVLFVTVFNQPAFQQLLTPAPAAPTVTEAKPLIKPDHATVVVEKGESLSTIIDREYHNTSVNIQKQVVASNRLEDSGVVQAGQMLRLPVIEQP
jgi:LysM repeat protein